MGMIRWVAAIVGSGLLLGLLYVLISFWLLIAPIAANLIGYGFSNYYLRQQQQFYYVHGPMRSIWQADAGCAEAHETLGYTARLGECQFVNAEFNTTLHYTERGWMMPTQSNGPKGRLVVVGDSQSMAWGVDHHESFSALLAAKGYTVNNYAISSYATEQQILSVLDREEFREADTLIIQYCENDMDKNKRRLSDYLQEEIALYRSQQTPSPLSFRQALANAASRFFENLSVSELVREPLHYFRAIGRGHGLPAYSVEKTEQHRFHLLDVLRQFPRLDQKQVLVFYSNSYGKKFSDWSEEQGNIRLLDLDLRRHHYHRIDDHLNRDGHRHVAEQLAITLSGMRSAL